MPDLPYEINMLDYQSADSGDVVTRSGEYLGKWHMDPNNFDDFYIFTPDDPQENALGHYGIGRLALTVQQWAMEKGIL